VNAEIIIGPALIAFSLWASITVHLDMRRYGFEESARASSAWVAVYGLSAILIFAGIGTTVSGLHRAGII